MPFTLRLGPVRYDSRRGVFTFKTRLIRIDSRTRSQRATAKTKRAKTRQDRRQTWQDLHGKNHATPRTLPTAPATSSGPATTPRPATARGPVKSFGPGPAGPWASGKPTSRPVRPGSGSPDGERPLTLAERTARVRRAGMCGGRTRDGSPCQRRGTCPPGTHH